MHYCEFCNSQYEPRKQVKNPRACSEYTCQKARQRDNERAWKERHSAQYDKEYYEIQRDKRLKQIQSIVESILECLKAGITMFGRQINFNAMESILMPFFLQLGLRRINKFWHLENDHKIKGLSSSTS